MLSTVKFVFIEGLEEELLELLEELELEELELEELLEELPELELDELELLEFVVLLDEVEPLEVFGLINEQDVAIKAIRSPAKIFLDFTHITPSYLKINQKSTKVHIKRKLSQK